MKKYELPASINTHFKSNINISFHTDTLSTITRNRLLQTLTAGGYSGGYRTKIYQILEQLDIIRTLYDSNTLKYARCTEADKTLFEAYCASFGIKLAGNRNYYLRYDWIDSKNYAPVEAKITTVLTKRLTVLAGPKKHLPAFQLILKEYIRAIEAGEIIHLNREI